MSQHLIETQSASFGYDDRVIVDRVDLTVDAGEVVALLGPNGSGKSTLVKGLFGLAPQLGGTVLLDGVERSKFDEHTRIGYVPQRHSLATS
ncbi:MAG TPA: ABC transporter ATP-binding protein, partial [Phycicoccus sp.]|nr:ABC transporter ATP-binding protein [Phycicoccus sp.]